MRARIASRPRASAEAWSVYWAVVASDSRRRRAIFSRTPEIRLSGALPDRQPGPCRQFPNPGEEQLPGLGVPGGPHRKLAAKSDKAARRSAQGPGRPDPIRSQKQDESYVLRQSAALSGSWPPMRKLGSTSAAARATAFSAARLARRASSSDWRLPGRGPSACGRNASMLFAGIADDKQPGKDRDKRALGKEARQHECRQPAPRPRSLSCRSQFRQRVRRRQPSGPLPSANRRSGILLPCCPASGFQLRLP